jgi:hypothetical protein
MFFTSERDLADAARKIESAALSCRQANSAETAETEEVAKTEQRATIQ